MDEINNIGFLMTVANWVNHLSGREAARRNNVFKKQFPQWHLSSGRFIDFDKFRADLQDSWRFASRKNYADAITRIDGRRIHYQRLLRRLHEEPDTNDYAQMERALSSMMDTLDWLRENVKKLKVCENPECKSERTFFFREYPNDNYCKIRCRERAKEIRQEQRDAQKPPKEFTRTIEERAKMSRSADRRWERERGKTGRPK